MHQQAYEWIEQHGTDQPVEVLDLGGRDVNGNPYDIWPKATRYAVLDIRDGPGVDFVADAGTWEPDQEYDVVVSAETFEHTANWAAICRTAYKALKPGGTFIVTTAGPGRPPHSAVDGMQRLLPGEHYANVPGFELKRVLTETGFRDIVVDTQSDPADTRSVAVK